ncbi:MAG: DUF86 domain-containing protein [Parcubacteria group bacterium]|jgi:uncharacterized protein YutE (UPF0331/DUF86 family)
MLNKILVQEKINKIENYTKEIEPLLKFSVDEIMADILKLRTLERNFQLIVDTILDINTHIIAAENLKAPDNLQETLSILGEAGILPFEFVEKFAPAVGLRNKIVHDYEKIDQKKVITDLKNEMEQFAQYIVCIDEFINKK